MNTISRTVTFLFEDSKGSRPLNIMNGTVELIPTNTRRGSEAPAMPSPYSVPLVDGVASIPDVEPTPAVHEDGTIDWAYLLRVSYGRKDSWEYLVGVPDDTTDISYALLPRYFTVSPGNSGQVTPGPPGARGPQGERGPQGLQGIPGPMPPEFEENGTLRVGGSTGRASSTTTDKSQYSVQIPGTGVNVGFYRFSVDDTKFGIWHSTDATPTNFASQMVLYRHGTSGISIENKTGATTTAFDLYQSVSFGNFLSRKQAFVDLLFTSGAGTGHAYRINLYFSTARSVISITRMA